MIQDKRHSEPRWTHNRILELIDEGYYTYETILKELLSWLGADDINDFYDTAFGNEGIEIEPIEDDEEEDEEDDTE